jgi:drug/metabolite transporter (DMT)-like permease
MKTKLWAIILMVVCTVFTSSAQILYKLGAEKLIFDIVSIITNWQILLGLVFYGIGAVLVIISFRGGEVTVLYPIITSSYIWVTLGSWYFLKESISVVRWSGVLLIMMGILIITLSKKSESGEEIIKYAEPVE